MTTRETVTHNTGQTFPIAGLLGVAFVVLKLTGVISWSWLWVTAPFWAPLAATLAIVVAVAAVVGLFYVLSHIFGGGK